MVPNSTAAFSTLDLQLPNSSMNMIMLTIDALIDKLVSSGKLDRQKLLSTTIDLNEVGSHGRTLLMAAASEGLVDAVNVLVGLGASVTAAGDHGLTALHEAAANGHVPTVLRLLEMGALVDAETEHGVTPYLCTAAWEHIEVAKLLLAHEADRSHRDHMGDSAADIAYEKCNQRFLEFLDGQNEDF